MGRDAAIPMSFGAGVRRLDGSPFNGSIRESFSHRGQAERHVWSFAEALISMKADADDINRAHVPQVLFHLPASAFAKRSSTISLPS